METNIVKYAFISYSSKDKEKALKIYEELKKNDVEVWLDRKNLTPAENFNDEIAVHIENCAAFILLISENSAKSEYVDREINCSFLRKIFPVILDKTNGSPNIRAILKNISGIPCDKEHFESGKKELAIEVKDYFLGISRGRGIVPKDNEIKVRNRINDLVNKINRDGKALNETVNSSLVHIRKYGMGYKYSYEGVCFYIDEQKDHLIKLQAIISPEQIIAKLDEKVLKDVKEFSKYKIQYRQKCKDFYIQKMKETEDKFIRRSSNYKLWSDPNNKIFIDRQIKNYDDFIYAQIAISKDELQFTSKETFNAFVFETNNKLQNQNNNHEKLLREIDKLKNTEISIQSMIDKSKEQYFKEDTLKQFVTDYKNRINNLKEQYPGFEKEFFNLRFYDFEKLDKLVFDCIERHNKAIANQGMVRELTWLKNDEDKIKSSFLYYGSKSFNEDSLRKLISNYKNKLESIKNKYNWKGSIKYFSEVTLLYGDDYDRMEKDFKRALINRERDNEKLIKENDDKIKEVIREAKYYDKEREYLANKLNFQKQLIIKYKKVTGNYYNKITYSTETELDKVLINYDKEMKRLQKESKQLIDKVERIFNNVSSFMKIRSTIQVANKLIEEIESLIETYKKDKKLIEFCGYRLKYKDVDRLYDTKKILQEMKANLAEREKPKRSKNYW